MIQRIQPGKRYSEAVIANGLVFLSGMVPDNLDADATAQTANVLAQIDTLLAELGMTKSRIVDATIYLADMADYNAMNTAWDLWVEEDQAPARATVEARLANPEWKVEIKVTAAL
jgi:enamine deaminase RidA (YjgF/YER057c/UK114 family)